MIYALPFPQVILGHVNPVKISSLMGSLLEISTGDGVIKTKIDLAIAFLAKRKETNLTKLQ